MTACIKNPQSSARTCAHLTCLPPSHLLTALLRNRVAAPPVNPPGGSALQTAAQGGRSQSSRPEVTAAALLSALRAGTFLFFLWVEAVSWMEPISGLWLSPQPLETVNLTAEQGAWLIDSRGQQADTSAWAPALSAGYPVNQSGSGSTQTLVFSSLSPSTLLEASYPWVALQRNLENSSCF